MDKDLITELRKKLEKERALLEKELLKFADKDKKVKGDYDTRFPDLGVHSSAPDESAQEVNVYENLLALEYALELRLKDVTDALEKIQKNDNSFGKCEKCGKEIEIARLKINPAARTCISCSAQKT
ncbi:MAG: TraR/DksA family transcriptional regulator [Minisyncoccia bacterium]